MSDPARWLSVRVPVEAFSEILSDRLFELGALGVEEGETEAKVWFSNLTDGIRRKIADSLVQFGIPYPPVFESIKNQDWGSSWRKNFKPIQVTPRLWVTPPWEIVQPVEAHVITISPKMAFGTGSHETTRLCLEFIDDIVRPGDSVFDLGTGSGILAIAAILLGAEQTLAVDPDPEAIENALENIQLNHVTGINVRQGSIEIAAGNPFNLVFANIQRSVIEPMLSNLRRIVSGKLIVSGILDIEHERMTESFEKNGFAVESSRQHGEWMGYLLRPV
jgi:ribosomal protein L11 methyltransferase